jgi:CheY-like chemotaxis protein
MKAAGIVLYAEDEQDDVFFLEHAFEVAGSPHTVRAVRDGEQALEYLAGRGPFADGTPNPPPVLVLLDINLPKKSGLEVLEWMRQQPRFKSLPVLILTSSSRPEDREKARRLGADDYLLKPSDPRKLVELVKMLHDRWLIPARGGRAKVFSNS